MKTLGYMQMVEAFGLEVMPPACSAFLLASGHRRTHVVDGRQEEYYPPRDAPGDEWTDQLAFALKHEGVNLEILSALFRTAPESDLLAWVKSSPTSRYARVAWFLFEWLTGRTLSLSDVKQGNYVPVADPAKYYTLPKGKGAVAVRRQRVLNNLLGTAAYCPQVRRTTELKRFENMKLDERAAAQVRRFPADLVYRAIQYLYLKETKSSFAIEHIDPDQRRTARFTALLQQAGHLNCFSMPEIIRLQNAIVDERYAAQRFRDFQNYVGQSLGPAREWVHYVPPKPDALAFLMEGWFHCCQNMQSAGIHPVVMAAVSGYGFVFLHPFEDGNGRLHRFLIHHSLAAGNFSPSVGVFPVSATMLKQMTRYDASLEVYSKEIARHVEYQLDAAGNMTVTNDSTPFYRYPDFTAQAEALFGFIEDTIRNEMTPELEYLAAFDHARQRMRRVVDMPDRRMDLFVRTCLQGKGRLSKTKRALFKELTESECSQLEKIVQDAIAGLNRI